MTDSGGAVVVAARPDEEHHAKYRRLEPPLPGPPDPVPAPINRTLAP
ncbi:hypothetical protein [Embleya sp. NPDC020886]